jgi:hypothetical protein
MRIKATGARTAMLAAGLGGIARMHGMPRRAWRRLPVAVRFLIGHALVGFGLGALLTGALLWADPGGVGGILVAAPGHPGPMLLLWFFLSLTLGGVQTGVAVMLLGYPDPPAPRPGGRVQVISAQKTSLSVPITRATRGSAMR